jgi:hypothetical protein
MNDFNKERRNNSQVFQNVCWRCLAVSSQCDGSLDVLWMILHHFSQWLLVFQGVVSFGSRMDKGKEINGEGKIFPRYQ